MNLETIIAGGIYEFVKYLLISFLVLYIFFAVIVIRQVRLMTETLDVDLDGFISFISYLHLFLAGAVLIVAIFIL